MAAIESRRTWAGTWQFRHLSFFDSALTIRRDITASHQGYSMRHHRALRVCVLFLSGCVVLQGGCETMPPTEAVLEGTWELVKASDPGGANKIVLEINDQGRVTSVTNFVGGTSFRQNNATGQTTLTGLDVLIQTSTNLKFEAVFNDEITEAVGTQFTEFTLFGVTTTIDEGEATLRRI